MANDIGSNLEVIGYDFMFQLSDEETENWRSQIVTSNAERESFGDVLLVQRLRDAIDRLNPTIPEEAKETVCFSHRGLHP